MIEVSILDAGALDASIKIASSGIRIPDATLAEIHERAKEVVNAQVRRMTFADRLGFNTYWLVEHNFLIEGAELSPNPLMTQAAAAGLTKHIRLGQLSNILTWHHPIRIAEQLAQLDVMSGGRCEIGVGRGYQTRESELFNWSYGGSAYDQDKDHAAFEEALEIMIKAWTQLSFAHHGEFFQIPPSRVRWNHQVTRAQVADPAFGLTEQRLFDIDVNDKSANQIKCLEGRVILKEISVLPQPAQKPYPQITESLLSPRSIKFAAEHGFNGQCIFVTNERLRVMRDHFHEEARKAGFPDRLSRGEFKRGWDGARRRGIIVTYPVHIVENGIGSLEDVWFRERAAWEHFSVFGFQGLFSKGADLDPTTRITTELMQESGLFLFGSRQQIIDKLMEVHREIFDGDDMAVSLKFEQIGMSHTEVEDQMQHFAEEILPVLEQECGGPSPRVESPVDFRPLIERRNDGWRKGVDLAG